MPHFISIAVESPAHYVALDSQSNTWRGHFVTEPGAFPRDHVGARQFEVPGSATPWTRVGRRGSEEYQSWRLTPKNSRR
jgi:hypothetical protein